ncbi:HAD family hydrolase [Vallitalea okinawensis]|uniref:HAD family hydrolase n=1 Tax=Vallitalea okinawensis TaxID=2078660 RepID=UPI000CFDD3EC|nr:HAD family hydrolase [Vallitalea okinawensis]
MNNNIDVIFFDLFYTLTNPQYSNESNEYDVLGITQIEWEKYSEDIELYNERAVGKVRNSRKIIERILDSIGINLDEYKIQLIQNLREERFKGAIMNIEDTILDVLLYLKDKGKRLCIISNADIIDVMFWKESPLDYIFETAIFSYEVGYLKPHPKIYEIALDKMNVKPENCMFIGDGGSEELSGAKNMGMKTIQAGHFIKRDIEQLNTFNEYADYYIENFEEIKNIL